MQPHQDSSSAYCPYNKTCTTHTTGHKADLKKINLSWGSNVIMVQLNQIHTAVRKLLQKMVYLCGEFKRSVLYGVKTLAEFN